MHACTHRESSQRVLFVYQFDSCLKSAIVISAIAYYIYLDLGRDVFFLGCSDFASDPKNPEFGKLMKLVKSESKHVQTNMNII